MARIARAIDEGDHPFLKTLPGIGQQKARDIVAKLQGKVARFLLIQDAPQRAVPETPPMPEFAGEALAVLLQLAYKRTEAEAMIAETLERAPQVDDAEALLAEIYRGRNAAPSARMSDGVRKKIVGPADAGPAGARRGARRGSSARTPRSRTRSTARRCGRAPSRTTSGRRRSSRTCASRSMRRRGAASRSSTCSSPARPGWARRRWRT